VWLTPVKRGFSLKPEKIPPPPLPSSPPLTAGVFISDEDKDEDGGGSDAGGEALNPRIDNAVGSAGISAFPLTFFPLVFCAYMLILVLFLSYFPSQFFGDWKGERRTGRWVYIK
jgi:hypothetical protein